MFRWLNTHVPLLLVQSYSASGPDERFTHSTVRVLEVTEEVLRVLVLMVEQRLPIPCQAIVLLQPFLGDALLRDAHLLHWYERGQTNQGLQLLDVVALLSNLELCVVGYLLVLVKHL